MKERKLYKCPFGYERGSKECTDLRIRLISSKDPELVDTCEKCFTRAVVEGYVRIK